MVNKNILKTKFITRSMESTGLLAHNSYKNDKKTTFNNNEDKRGTWNPLTTILYPCFNRELYNHCYINDYNTYTGIREDKLDMGPLQDVYTKYYHDYDIADIEIDKVITDKHTINFNTLNRISRQIKINYKDITDFENRMHDWGNYVFSPQARTDIIVLDVDDDLGQETYNKLTEILKPYTWLIEENSNNKHRHYYIQSTEQGSIDSDHGSQLTTENLPVDIKKGSGKYVRLANKYNNYNIITDTVADEKITLKEFYKILGKFFNITITERKGKTSKGQKKDNTKHDEIIQTTTLYDYSREQEHELIKACVNIFEACKGKGLRHVLYMSLTSAILFNRISEEQVRIIINEIVKRTHDEDRTTIINDCIRKYHEKQENIQRYKHFKETTKYILGKEYNNYKKSIAIIGKYTHSNKEIIRKIILNDGINKHYGKEADNTMYIVDDKLTLITTIKEILSELKYYNGYDNKNDVQYIINEILKYVYFIKPNPASDFTLLVFENEYNVRYISEYNNSTKIKKEMNDKYNTLNNTILDIISFQKFINMIVVYEEIKTSNQSVLLLSNKYILDTKQLTISYMNNSIPISVTGYEYEQLTDNEIHELDKLFSAMYDTKDYKKFLYYLACMLNKENCKQNVFINIARSGSGKSAITAPLQYLGLMGNAKENLLKSTELYNLFNYNSISINESQNETINGSTLSQLADSTPITVSRKSKNAITYRKEDKPVLELVGESLPFLTSLNDGTIRRLLLLPQKRVEYRSTDNKTEYQQAFNILYNSRKAVGIIEYYMQKIKKYNILEDKEKINKSMKTTLEQIAELGEDKKEVLSKYLEFTPYYDTENKYLIEYNTKKIGNFIKWLDDKYLTTNHFIKPQHAYTWFRKELKKEVGNIGTDYFTRDRIKYHNLFQLTESGYYQVKIYNKECNDDKRIHTIIY